MSFLAGLVGSGIGLIVVVVTIILLGHVSHAPGAAHPWIYRALIVLAYGGGALLALTSIGNVWLSLVNWFAAFFGGVGSGAGHAVIVIASVILILGLIIGIWKAPNAEVAKMAALAPFLLMLTTSGFIHSFWVSTSAPAQQVATQFATWLGG